MKINDKHPAVSIIIPVYNGSNYLENAINCALSQTYENLEVIVVNDGSTDNGETERIALSFGEKIRYIRKENGGVSSALNLGIAEMHGQYFSWLSHDDAYTENKVSDAISLLLEGDCIDEKVIAYSGGGYIDKNGEFIKPFPVNLQTKKKYTPSEMLEYAVSHRTLNGCCMLIPKSAFEECGGFDETLRYSQDSLMWYKMFICGYSLVYDGKPNVMYRLHGTQTSRTRHDLFEKDSARIAEILVPEFKKFDNSKNAVLFKFAYKMAKLRCKKVVEVVYGALDDEHKFSLLQRTRISLGLFAGSFRGKIKKLYYKYVLRLTV